MQKKFKVVPRVTVTIKDLSGWYSERTIEMDNRGYYVGQSYVPNIGSNLPWIITKLETAPDGYVSEDGNTGFFGGLVPPSGLGGVA